MKVLFVDDMEDRYTSFMKRKTDNVTEVTYAPTYAQAIWQLENVKFDILFLDHDLSETAIGCDPDDIDEKTGTDLANEIAEMQLDPKPGIIVHSLNPVGAKRMETVLREAGYDVVRVPFYML